MKLLILVAVISGLSQGQISDGDGAMADKDSSFSCYECEGGYDTTCSKNIPRGTDGVCEGPDAHCYEAIVWYQRGALKLVQRRCWQPPPSARYKDFCKDFNNPVGELKKCRVCRENLCNGNLFSETITRPRNCTDEL